MKRRFSPYLLILSLLITVFWKPLGAQNLDKTTDSLSVSPPDSILKVEAVIYGASEDTLMRIYGFEAIVPPAERARLANERIARLKDAHTFRVDSLQLKTNERSVDLMHGQDFILRISQQDADAHGKSIAELAEEVKTKLAQSLDASEYTYQILLLLGRIALVFAVLFVAWNIFKGIGKLHLRLLNSFRRRAEGWFKDIEYRNYTFLTAAQQKEVVFNVIKSTRWLLYGALLYLSLPILFSIFPFSRTWAEQLFQLLWMPLTSVFSAVWDYIPNLFSIIVIVFVMRYFIRFVRYIFHEIHSERLQFSGFHADWAMPTYNIVRFLLYAFMLVLIFPYLPGSDSAIFKGVSVFLGLLVSLGSSSAISNMVAGLVITYMRPFKPGDRIKIGDVAGDVVEKTMLVTRVRTTKNEIVTIPNAAVLSGNTTNYSSLSQENGLIIHTTITLGYDLPWQKVHRSLQRAARKTVGIEDHPSPFVMQTELQDFYVAYQINGFTKQPARQATILSDLHRHILDVCKEDGIEILSPHYRAERDGSEITIPPDYTPPPMETPDKTKAKD